MQWKRRSVEAAAARRVAARVGCFRRWCCYLAGWAVSGCTAPASAAGREQPDPSVKIPAYKKAVRKKDKAAVRQLVTDLDNDDPAVRLYAIDARCGG